MEANSLGLKLIHIQFISVNKLTNRKAKEQRKATHNAYEAFKDCLSC